MTPRLGAFAASLPLLAAVIAAAVRSQGVGLTSGQRAFLADQGNPPAVVASVDAIVRAANETRR